MSLSVGVTLMSERLRIVEEFVAADSALAARALEPLDPEAASALIEQVDDSKSVTVLAAMLPQNAARCIDALPTESAARYLAALRLRHIVRILRNLSSDKQKNLLRGLPAALAMRVRLSLSYSPDQAGGWMHPLVLSLPADCSIAEARDRVTADSGYEFSLLYTVDEEGKLGGAVSIPVLFAYADETRTIAQIAQPADGFIPASASLVSAAGHPGWEMAEILPVTDPDGVLIGILRYADLRSALARDGRSKTFSADREVFDIAEKLCLGLADFLIVCLSARLDGADRPAKE